jgi:hypothetical protein
MTRAVGAVSTGANTPSTRQRAGTVSVAGTHAACRLTLRTASPISFGAIVTTSAAAVQSASGTMRLGFCAEMHAHANANIVDLFRTEFRGRVVDDGCGRRKSEASQDEADLY